MRLSSTDRIKAMTDGQRPTEQLSSLYDKFSVIIGTSDENMAGGMACYVLRKVSKQQNFSSKSQLKWTS